MKEALAANDKIDPIRFLVGTKSDLLPKKALEGLESHASFIAQEIDAEYFSTSSRDDKEVTNLFRRIVSLAFDNSVQRLIRPADYHVVKNNIKSMLNSFWNSFKFKFADNFISFSLISRFIAFSSFENGQTQTWECLNRKSKGGKICGHGLVAAYS